MNERRRVFLNASMSALQVVVSGASFLILYRYLLESIGHELAGVWALVLSWTVAISFADLGMTGAAVKFVSRHRARADHARVIQVVETSILSSGIVLLTILPVVYPLFERLLHVIIEPPTRIADALAVLPYAVSSFWLTSVGGIVMSCIDGTQRVYLRNVLVMISALLYLGFALLLVPRAGLIGLAQAQVLHAAITLVVGWIMLKALIPNLPLLPFRWNKSVFKEILGYSVNFQFISLSQLLFQPVAKSLLSKFGDVGQVFYFEMAHKLVSQLRALIVIAHQSLVPTIALWYEKSKERVQRIYRASFRVLLYFVTAGLPLLIGLTPIISRLWIGEYDERFIAFAQLLFAGWFLNILTNPAYFGYLGIGRLQWNLIGHLLIGGMNVGLGLLLGSRYGGLGIVIAYVIAIPLGSGIPLWAYHREYGIQWRELVDRHTAFLAVAGCCGWLVVYLIHKALAHTMNPWVLTFIVSGIYVLAIFVPLWKHPVRKRLQKWITALDLLGRNPLTSSSRP